MIQSGTRDLEKTDRKSWPQRRRWKYSILFLIAEWNDRITVQLRTAGLQRGRNFAGPFQTVIASWAYTIYSSGCEAEFQEQSSKSVVRWGLHKCVERLGWYSFIEGDFTMTTRDSDGAIDRQDLNKYQMDFKQGYSPEKHMAWQRRQGQCTDLVAVEK